MLPTEGVVVGGVGHAFLSPSFLFFLLIGDRHSEGLYKLLKNIDPLTIKHFDQGSALFRRYVGCLIGKAVYRFHDLVVEDGLLRPRLQRKIFPSQDANPGKKELCLPVLETVPAFQLRGFAPPRE
mgnify:CR=1 FL=1